MINSILNCSIWSEGREVSIFRLCYQEGIPIIKSLPCLDCSKMRSDLHCNKFGEDSSPKVRKKGANYFNRLFNKHAFWTNVKGTKLKPLMVFSSPLKVRSMDFGRVLFQ